MSANCCDRGLQLLFSSFELRLAWFSNHVTAPITFRLCNKSNSCISNGISNKNDYFAISGLNRCKELSCVFSLIAFLNIERIATAQLSSFLAWKTLSLSDAWIWGSLFKILVIQISLLKILAWIPAIIFFELLPCVISPLLFYSISKCISNEQAIDTNSYLLFIILNNTVTDKEDIYNNPKLKKYHRRWR